MWVSMCVFVWIWLHAHENVCICRIGQIVQETSPVADTVPVESQQPALKDDHDYSTVDDVQQQMLAIAGNPAYKFVPEHDQKPVQEDDQAYSNIDISQQEEAVTSGKLGYSTALRAAASDKWHSSFPLQC